MIKMFKNQFQGGPYVDVLSLQGKDPLSKLKLQGTVRKEFDNDLRTFIVFLQGDPSRCNVKFPKSSKQTLHLTQRIIVFQLFLHSGQSFSLEVTVSTQNNQKLRLNLSNSSKEIFLHTHHVKLPCSLVQSNTWINLCLDLDNLVSGYFDGMLFEHVDSIFVSATCKLKRVFTVKDKPANIFDLPEKFTSNVSSFLQVIDPELYTSANINIRSSTGNVDKRASHKLSNKNENSHIAFGSRFRSGSINNDVNNDHVNSENKNSELISHGHSILPSKPSNRLLTKSKTEAKGHKSNNSFIIEPKPPNVQPPKLRRKTRPRVKSADISRTAPEKAKNDMKKLSKSADSRSRTRPTDCENSSDEKTIKLPPLNFKRAISRSSIELDNAEKLVSTQRDNHFSKSQSLNVLPDIGVKNKRYQSSTENLSTISGSKNLNEDSVFTDDKETNENLVLGDDKMVDDYLKRRTRSSCHDDDSTYSSCTSDLYTYSSRPRSVSGHQQKEASDRQQKEASDRQQKQSEKNPKQPDEVQRKRGQSLTINNENFQNDFKISQVLSKSDNSKFDSIRNGELSDLTSNSHFHNVFNSDSEDHKSPHNDRYSNFNQSRNNQIRRDSNDLTHQIVSYEDLEEDYIQSQIKSNDKNVKNDRLNDVKGNNHDETYSLPQQNVTCTRLDPNNIEGNCNLELSWEYSESTSMLVLPSDLKKHLREDEKTQNDVSLDPDIPDVVYSNDDIVEDTNNDIGRQTRNTIVNSCLDKEEKSLKDSSFNNSETFPFNNNKNRVGSPCRTSSPFEMTQKESNDRNSRTSYSKSLIESHNVSNDQSLQLKLRTKRKCENPSVNGSNPEINHTSENLDQVIDSTSRSESLTGIIQINTDKLTIDDEKNIPTIVYSSNDENKLNNIKMSNDDESKTSFVEPDDNNNIEYDHNKYNNDNLSEKKSNDISKNSNQHSSKSILHTSYVMRESCESDTMSWLQESVDPSSPFLAAQTNIVDKIKSPGMLIRQRLREQLGSIISKEIESGDCDYDGECSEHSDDTDTHPMKKFRNYRYQDEIKSIGSTLDLSATIPATPRLGDQAGYGKDENNNDPNGTLNDCQDEEMLDLMFDPELNCYYDPVTHKYYELN